MTNIIEKAVIMTYRRINSDLLETCNQIKTIEAIAKAWCIRKNIP